MICPLNKQQMEEEFRCEFHTSRESPDVEIEIPGPSPELISIELDCKPVHGIDPTTTVRLRQNHDPISRM